MVIPWSPPWPRPWTWRIPLRRSTSPAKRCTRCSCELTGPGLEEFSPVFCRKLLLDAVKCSNLSYWSTKQLDHFLRRCESEWTFGLWAFYRICLVHSKRCAWNDSVQKGLKKIWQKDSEWVDSRNSRTEITVAPTARKVDFPARSFLAAHPSIVERLAGHILSVSASTLPRRVAKTIENSAARDLEWPKGSCVFVQSFIWGFP